MTVGRGRCMAGVVYLAIVGLVAGGLAWATRAALQLEHANRISLALWRLDGRVSPILAREDGRPISHYELLFPPVPAVYSSGKPVPLGTVLMPTPLLNAELPDWLALHFVVDARFGWRSPQVPAPALLAKLRSVNPGVSASNATPERGQLLAHLKEQFPLTNWFDLPATPENASQQKEQGRMGRGQTMNPNWADYQSQQAGQVLDAEVKKRLAQQSDIRNDVKGTDNNNRGGESFLAPNPIILHELAWEKSMKCAVANRIEDMKPEWYEGRDGELQLLLMRKVDADELTFLQGVVIDWPKLRQVLQESLREELLPNADLQPADANIQGDHLAALPVRLDAGPAPMTLFPLNTPMRWGLVFAWGAALVALVMVGFSGWSLMDLSERRFRFVSAVTHELRTPLTTLRLYLDMLTGGLVREEKQRDEYLMTLHGEADRLHRLIANVLDFARLERQQPNVNVQAVRVRDLLATLRVEWEGTCKSADKLITVDVADSVPETITTDPDLCRQLLGNLIDNACKYSREATDPRVMVQATTEDGRVVFTVEDRGPGVPPREGRSVFRPFRRGSTTPANAGGVGLGLALADRWAKLLGGELRLSNANPGARFQFICPSA